MSMIVLILFGLAILTVIAFIAGIGFLIYYLTRNGQEKRLEKKEDNNAE